MLTLQRIGVAASGGLGGVSGQEDAIGADARRRHQRRSPRWLLLGVRSVEHESGQIVSSTK